MVSRIPGVRAASLAGTVLALTGLAAPASAVTVSGTVTPTDTNEFQLAQLQFPGPGVYQVGFDLSRPGDFVSFAIDWTQSYDFFDPVTGMNIGGDDVDMNNTATFETPTLHYSRQFELLPPYTAVTEFYIERGFYHGGLSLNGAFTGTEPVSFNLFADPQAVIPEPKAWFYLVVAFGALGALLRRRRARTLAAA
jgi:hypothetical protein